MINCCNWLESASTGGTIVTQFEAELNVFGYGSLDQSANFANQFGYVYTPLESQFGLKLVPKKGIVEVLLLDRAEKSADG
jgi:uncharacterized protein (TIGR03435 family)